MNEIGLFFDNISNNNGPGKVAGNLVKGLHMLGVNVKINEHTIVNGCLQVCSAYDSLPDYTLVGPNIFVEPTKNDLRFLHHVVPGQWVKPYYYSYPELKHITIDIWPVGIDTDIFNVTKNITQDCFIYFKNRSNYDLEVLKELLNKRGLKYSVLEYGKYNEKQLLETCTASNFCILLTGTESQGIAYMEILSCNVPCLVFNMPQWIYGRHCFPATSVPYFSDQCGFITNTMDGIELFFNNINQYSPREYILSNHTLIDGANNYLNILEKYL